MRVLVVLAVAVSLVAPAAGAVPCKTRTGAVVLREACRAKETRVHLAVPGAPGAPGLPGPDGSAGAWTIRVVDAAGRELGPAATVAWWLRDSFRGDPIMDVLLQHDGIGGAALLGVDHDGTPAGRVYYAADDCSGPPMVEGGTFLPALQVIGDTVFVPGAPPATPAAKSYESIETRGGCTGVTPRGGCCHPFTGKLGEVLLATTTTLDALGVTPPLRAVGP